MSSKRLFLFAAFLVIIAATLACGRTEPVIITPYVIITETPETEPEPQMNLVVTARDDFDGPDLDAVMWAFGTNSSGSGYALTDGDLYLWSGSTNGGGAWLLSNQLYTPDDTVRVFETRLRVSNTDGGLWGFWGDNHEGYLMFGVNENAQLQAWVMADRNGPLQSFTIDGVDITQWHTYRIEFTGFEAAYFVDDILMATHTTGIPAGKPMHIRLDRVSWGQNETLYVDYILVGEYR